MIAKPLPSRLMGCLVFLAALSLSFGAAHADRILSRHTRAMMIDMRGFPDTEPFVCKGAGFQRNETDCTQFFRCVDFNNNGKHTIFRFMCGPMAVFDESRSLCTGPELSVPPCPKDQLDAFFVSMKPMNQGSSSAPSPPSPPSPTSPPSPPVTQPDPTTTGKPTTTTIATTTTTPTTTTTTTGTPTIPTIPTIPTVPPTPTTTFVELSSPDSIPAVSSTTPVSIPPSTTPPVTEPSRPVVEVVTTTTTSAPVILTEPSTTPAPITVPVPPATTTPTPTTTQVVEIITTTTSAPVIVTEPSTTPVPVTIPVPSATSPASTTTQAVEITTTTVAAPVVTNPTPTEAIPTPTTTPTTTTTETIIEVSSFEPVPTEISTLAPVSVSTAVPVTTTTSVDVITKPPTPQVEPTLPPFPPVSPTTTSTTTPAPVVIGEDIKGFISIGENEFIQNVQQVISTVTVTPGVTWAVVSQGEGSRIIIKEDGTSETTFSVIPPGTILMINTTQTGGVWNNVANGLYTTNSTTTSFPPGTTFSIAKIGANGQIISWQTILTTISTSVLSVPTNSFLGSVQFVNQKVVTIGGWTFTTTYFTTGTTISSFGVLQPSTTTTSTSSQTTITTTSAIITGDQQFISGIITVGAQNDQSPSAKDISIPGGDLLAIVPQGGQGIVTLIEEGSTSSTDFPITPGSFLAVLAPSNGVGIVTNVVQSMFTSSTTTITFPAGSIVSILKVGIDGQLVRVSFVQVNSSFTLFTTVQSIVGIVKTTNTGVMSNIGTGIFSIQQLAGSTKPVYFGVVNVNPIISTTTQVESLSGIIQIGDATFLNLQQPATTVQTIQILPDTTSAILVSGEIKITEEDGTSIKQTAVSIPSGGILGIVTLKSGGEISGISNGYFTTTSTQIIFPSGTRFGIVIIMADGRMSLQNPIDTTIRTTITVPVGSTFGVLTLSSKGVVTGIGSALFSTQYLLLGDSTGPNVPATLGNFGVVYFSEQFKLSQSTIINSAPVLQQLQTISAIVQIGVKDRFNSISSLIVPTGSTFAIIPSTGQGIVSVIEGGATSTFTVLPGQLFVVFNVQDATVTNIGDGFFTTTTTTFTFGTGSQYGIIRVGLEGQIILTEFTRTAQSVISVVVTSGSTAGIIQQTTDSRNIITSIGGAPFVIKIMNTVNPLATSELTAHAAVLDIGSFTTVVLPTITPETTTSVITTLAPVTSAPVTSAPSTSAPITAAPITSAPITSAPATSAPITSAPATLAPITSAPATSAPITSAPSTSAPITSAPTTLAPVTSAPEVVTNPPAPVTETTTVTTTTTVKPDVVIVAEDIKGFLTIGEREVIQNVQQVTPSITVPSGNSWGVVSQGIGSQIVIKQEGSSETTFSLIPPGAILMITTTQTGGVWNNVANGLFTTNSTTTSFPPGTTLSIVKIGTNGQIISTQILLTTTSTCVLTVPTNSFVGSLQLANQKVVTIGGWTFTTSYITTGTTTSSFGVLQPSSTTTTTSSQTIITTTSTTITGDQQFVSGIVTVGAPTEPFQPVQDLTVQSNNLLAIIPEGGKGIVTVVGETSQDFSITPGTFFGVLTPNNGVGTVTNLVQPMFTTTSTTITFPVGSSVSIYKVGIDGKVVRISVVEFTTAFTIITSSHSSVGIVQTTNTGLLTNIGTGSFSTQTLSGSTATVVFGVLNLNSVVQTSQVESLFGILQVGDATFLNRQESAAGQTIPIPAQSTSAIIASGDIQVKEETETSSTQTTFSIPSGGIFSMVTSTSGGEISGITNGYFTTSQTKITFLSGATFGIMIIRPDGTMSVQNPIITKVKTTITVPAGSTYGLIVLSAQNVVTGIGSTSFSTQNLLISDSTGPDVPAVLGNFGVMFFSEQFQLSKSVVITSAQVSTQLKTISSIIQIGVKEQFGSVADVLVSSGSSFGIIPAKGQGVVTINEGGSTSTFTILPGQMFGLLNAQGAVVTNIGDGFFTTSTTSMSFGSGTIYGVIKIGSDGSMISTEFTRTAQTSFTVTVATGSTSGIIQIASESSRIITRIGGASFAIRVLSSTITSTSSSGGSVGILDISGFVSRPVLSPSTSRPPVSTPQPPSAGPFTIDCSLNQLHQFPLDCSRFYQCFGEEGDRTVYIFPCAPGLIFDESTSQCLTASEAVCDDQSSINDTASSSEGVGGFFQINCSGDLYRYPLNCHNFYQCFKNEGQETIFVFSCAAGLVFDEKSRTCLLPSETSSCDVNDNLFRSPSIVFQLKQKIDVVSLISTSRTIVQQKSLTSSSTVSEISFSQPHQSGRGSTKRKMGYAGETAADRQVGQRRINTESRKAKESKATVPVATVTGNFRPRLFDSGVYGVRISPLSKSLFGQSKTN